LVVGARTHRAATKTVGRDTAPSIIAAQHIKTAMAGMDAAEAGALLGKPARIPQMLQTYEARRLEASKALIAAAENITYGDQERVPIQTIEVGLGNYAELAQRARDMHDVAAYRQAADLADSKLYPAADALDKANRDALDRIYENQLSYSLATRTSAAVRSIERAKFPDPPDAPYFQSASGSRQHHRVRDAGLLGRAIPGRNEPVEDCQTGRLRIYRRFVARAGRGLRSQRGSDPLSIGRCRRQTV
jgi:hypothetical protein